MKYRLLILFVFLLLGNRALAQRQYYSLELNAGICQPSDHWFGPFPGSSYLIGSTYISKKNIVLESQIGLAFPSVGTAKIGIGGISATNNTILTVGIRPYPSHAYIQAQWISKKKNIAFTASYEESAYSLLNSSGGYKYEDVSFYSVRLITIGYKWRIGTKFGKEGLFFEH